MCDTMYQQCDKVVKDWYGKLMAKESECFGKMYSSGGKVEDLPQFPTHLEEVGEEEFGAWCFKDPSKFVFKSYLVSKWKGMKEDMHKEVFGITVVEKLLAFFFTVASAHFAKLYFYEPEKVAQFVDIAKLVLQFAMVVLLPKLLKVATLLQFVAWKSFGVLAKLEFAQICAGGCSLKVIGKSMPNTSGTIPKAKRIAVCFWYGFW